jgi:chemotaxis signal transduction protein
MSDTTAADILFDLEEVAPSAAPTRSAQGIVCGAWALAFEFGWARNIVEQFDLVAVPQSPEWLVGAASVDGELLPVVDMARLISPNPIPFQRVPGQRLLVGGEGADSVAMVFTRRPQMIRYEPKDGAELSAVPASLRELARGYAINERGEYFIEVDGIKLVKHLSELGM